MLWLLEYLEWNETYTFELDKIPTRSERNIKGYA